MSTEDFHDVVAAAPPLGIQPRLMLQFGEAILRWLLEPDAPYAARIDDLRSRVASMRREVHQRWGVQFGPVTLRDHPRLDPDGWQVVIDAEVVAAGSCRAGGWMLLAHDGVLPEVGVAGIDPTYGLPVRWVSEAEVAPFRKNPAFVVVDTLSVMCTGLSEAFDQRIAALLGFEQLDAMLSGAPSALTAAVAEAGIDRVALLRLTRHLLVNRRPVGAFALILEQSVVEAGRLRAGDEAGWAAAVCERIPVLAE